MDNKHIMADTIIPISKSTPVAQKSNQQIETVTLPSKGYFYPESHPLSKGTVDIYQVTARHEDILSNTTLLKKGTVLDEFLKALIATPNVSVGDLLIGDQNALYIAARKSAYGEIYSPKIKCPACEVESTVRFDLNTIGVKEFKLDGITKGENRLTFTLPKSGRVVGFSLTTVKDDADISAEIKALVKFGNAATIPEVTTKLKYTIKTIDGESNRVKVKNFVDDQLTAIDSLALRRFIRESTPDIDMSFNFVCPECEHSEKLYIPLGPSFFWPSTAEN